MFKNEINIQLSLFLYKLHQKSRKSTNAKVDMGSSRHFLKSTYDFVMSTLVDLFSRDKNRFFVNFHSEL